MIDPKMRLRWRRQFRKSKKQVVEAGSQTDARLERYFLRRMPRLVTVRRFVATWVLLLLIGMTGLFVQSRLLIPYYQEVRAVPGGTYREGLLGSFTTANPIYATGSVNSAVSKLVFSGLFTYDKSNQLTGDLATEFTVNDTGEEYIVSLQRDVFWHDGEPFTADDVVFTYETISNPDARSPLFSSWSETEVEAVDDHTVKFTLPNPFVTFPHAMTNGIIPKHILDHVSPRQLRSDVFNTAQPIGTGPFKWDTIEVAGFSQEDREERIALQAYDEYHRGRPHMDRFIIRTYRSEERLIQSFIERDVYAITGIDSVSHELLESHEHHTYIVPLTGQVGVFFKTKEPVFEERSVRQALVQSIDTDAVRSAVGGPLVPSFSPLLPVHPEYNPEIVQLPYDIEQAVKRMEEAGWNRGEEDEVWKKDGKELSFSVVALNSTDGRSATQELQRQWDEFGARVDVTLQSEEELQGTIAQHEFMSLLHGIAIGPDPDVFAFWHSSQTDVLAKNRLNLSDYSSSAADAALESGRTRSDDELRSVKYTPFLEAWRRDAPALMLYQPRFIYLTQTKVEGLDPLIMNAGTDRMFSVDEWQVRRARLDKHPYTGNE